MVSLLISLKIFAYDVRVSCIIEHWYKNIAPRELS